MVVVRVQICFHPPHRPPTKHQNTNNTQPEQQWRRMSYTRAIQRLRLWPERINGPEALRSFAQWRGARFDFGLFLGLLRNGDFAGFDSRCVFVWWGETKDKTRRKGFLPSLDSLTTTTNPPRCVHPQCIHTHIHTCRRGKEHHRGHGAHPGLRPPSPPRGAQGDLQKSLYYYYSPSLALILFLPFPQ